jgi:tetratricopeptide (TPR) repeat protein
MGGDMRGVAVLLLLITMNLSLAAEDLGLYHALASEARALYEAEQYLDAAEKFEQAFAALEGEGRFADRVITARAWALAGGADEAFRHLEALAGNALFTRLDWIEGRDELRQLQGDHRWAPMMAAMRAHAERAQTSRAHIGSFNYTRVMLLFNANAEALNRRLPPGWVVSDHGVNIVIGFCDVWAAHDAESRLISDSQVKYIPFNGVAWNRDSGESVNFRYTEYVDHPQRLLAASPEDVSRGDLVPSRIRRESRIEHSETLGDIYHEHWRIEPQGGGVLELRVTFPHQVTSSLVGSSMDALYARNPERRLHLRNEELHNVIKRSAAENRLLEFELKIDLPGWQDVFDGTEQLISARFIPTSKRDVFIYSP